MKRDLCWEKSFVRNSFDEVYVMGSRCEFPIIKQPVLKTENHVLRTGYSVYKYSTYIYVTLIYISLANIYISLANIYISLADSFPVDYPLSKSGLNRWVLSMAWSNSH